MTQVSVFLFHLDMPLSTVHQQTTTHLQMYLSRARKGMWEPGASLLASPETTLLKSSSSVHLHVLPRGADFRGFLQSPHSQSGSHFGVICPLLSHQDFMSTV